MRRLVINRFGRHGIHVIRPEVRVEGNYIGTTADGAAAASNGGAGVWITDFSTNVVVGGTTPAQRNVISGNRDAGVWVDRLASGAAIRGNYIGTDATGSRSVGNGREGVLIDASARTGTVGGTAAGAGNVISGNGASGIRVTGASPGTGIVIEGNRIGTDAAGSRALPNGASPATPYRDGITLAPAGGVRIGGPTVAARNVISGNVGAGVRASGVAPALPDIRGNFIGTDATGSAAVGNGEEGVAFAEMPGSAGPALISGNLISANGAAGVHLSLLSPTAARLVVDFRGNYIGTNVTGSAPLGNGGNGIELTGRVWGRIGPFENIVRPTGVVGPINPAGDAPNVISANRGHGIAAFDTDTPVGVQIRANLIGTDAAGSADLGNAGHGVFIHGDSGSQSGDVRSSVISGNGGDGVHGDRLGFMAFDNFIGTNAAGTAAIPNDGNGVAIQRASFTIGLPASGRPPFPPVSGNGRNVISGNRGHGVLIDGAFGSARSSQSVRLNYIGLDANGTRPVGNGGTGVHVLNAPVLIGGVDAGNTISGNVGNGVTLVATIAPTSTSGFGSAVEGNRIGTNEAGDAAAGLGNGGHGVAVFNSRGNTIGPAPDAPPSVPGNVIAFNGGDGVRVEGVPAGTTQFFDSARISRNSIYSNGGLGIDLVAPTDGRSGVTPNDPRDPDFGVNSLLNYPVILSANAAASVDGTVVNYTLDVPPGTYLVEFFAVPGVDPSGDGEGRAYLSTATVNVGNAPLTTFVVLIGVSEGTLLTATTSEVQRTTTSEFSAAFRVGPQLPPATVRGRHIFYNGTAFDGYTVAANAADDRAIATDKQALLPGQGPATFANVVTAAQGINGVMVDLQGMTPGTQVSAADFEFRSGAGGDPSTWGLVPYPPQVSVRRGAGVGGSDRVTLTWTPGLTHTWLEVTVLPTLRTGLEQSDR
ncbi:MAG TPA: right-handed parallel beta-helix repeat-containing protein, partial [Tepidisphaeraceae bacterium]|nr:right-handed parallel beta-helix repeat-containing protein [Tepidisphaeraceae bacterium]